ncbi:MAG: hypothetical protein HQM04_15615 [Magnetococcales bacterium]|nr:hypothetical protein [Magnetococcales bacterium]
MGLSLFQVKKGINIDGLSQVLPGSGVPGAAGDTALAPKGSVYLDSANGQMYVKKTAGSGTDKWVRIQDKGDMDAALQGISWREPAKLHVTTSYADLAAATTAMNTGTLDGTAVVANDRILFDNITGVNKNVFVVTGTPGSGATLVEDTNTATKGDAIYVQSGTDAGKQFSYNGTIWVQQGAASSTEIGFLQAFVGKSADGNETPDYSSNNVVTDAGSLETAIGELDNKIGTGYTEPVNFIQLNDAVMKGLHQLDINLSAARTFHFGSISGGTAEAVCTTDFATHHIEGCFSVEWRVVVASGNDKWAGTVSAIFNRATSEIDYNISSILSLGVPIAGLEVYPVVTSTTLSLMVNATNAVTTFTTRTLNCYYDIYS